MISPMTAPGTKIICVDDGPTELFGVIFDNDGLRRGEVYTLEGIFPAPDVREEPGFIVTLAELKRDVDLIGWNIGRFKIASLPRSITSLLDVVSTDLEAAEC